MPPETPARTIMENTLTLIGNRASRPLERDMVSLAMGALEEAGAECDEPRWLSPEQACDIGFEGFSDQVGEAAVRQYLQDLPLDIVAQPSAGRKKRLLVSDMDSTMIEQECIVEVADYAGRREEVHDTTEAAMRGEIDFDESLIRRAAMLKGLEVKVLHTAMNERVTEMPGARILISTMRRDGAFTALVSGGFTYFTDLVSRELGFDADMANTLEIIDGRLTGNVIPPILGKQAKKTALETFVSHKGLSIEQSLAVGDGANDIPMIQSAGLGIAYHAKPLVAASAGARIDHGDLTALLYVQGYSEDEFAAPTSAP